MTKEEKVKVRIENSIIRRQKKKDINERRKYLKSIELEDCPFDVEINGLHGTCTCGGVNRESCAMDI